MKSISRRRMTFAIVLLVVAVLIVAFVFLIWIPKGREISSANAQLASLQTQQSSSRGEIASLEAFKAQLPNAKAELARLTTAIPAYPQLSSFILMVNSISNESGISFISISPAQPAPQAPVTSVPGASQLPAAVDVSIQVKGGYFQVLDFLNRLDNLPRLVVTNTLGLTGSGTQTGPVTNGSQVSASLQAKIFTQNIPIGTPGVPIASTTTTIASAGSTNTTAAG
ncbi:MAG: type 4a pilus biogenesis protein PilO [Actinomycetota bacterium]|nr:type 4a pilus biogenesis protein PilO [Actinomycetota bacterium]